jgi:hypothetical protein
MLLTFARSQRVIAHFSFDAARIPPLATRDNAFFEDFIQYRFMKSLSLLRGE